MTEMLKADVAKTGRMSGNKSYLRRGRSRKVFTIEQQLSIFTKHDSSRGHTSSAEGDSLSYKVNRQRYFRISSIYLESH